MAISKTAKIVTTITGTIGLGLLAFTGWIIIQGGSAPILVLTPIIGLIGYGLTSVSAAIRFELL